MFYLHRYRAVAAELCGSELAHEDGVPGAEMQRLYRPLPEQARSHRRGHKRRYFAQPSLCFTCIDIERLPLNFVGVSLLTKTAFQALKCSGCTGPFPSKLGPTGEGISVDILPSHPYVLPASISSGCR